MDRLLLIDDEPQVLKALGRGLRLRLRPDSYVLEVFSDPLAALSRLAQQEFDLIIADYRMPELDGVTLLTQARALWPDTARVILSGQADQSAMLAAINEAQIARFVAKPWLDAEMALMVMELLRCRRQRCEERALAADMRRQLRSSGSPSLDLSPQERERHRVEALEPGITQVKLASDGSVIVELPEA